MPSPVCRQARHARRAERTPDEEIGAGSIPPLPAFFWMTVMNDMTLPEHTPATIRLEMWLTLARAFQAPSSPAFAEAVLGPLAADLKDFATEAGFDADTSLAALGEAIERIDSPTALLVQYSRLFLSPPSPARRATTGRPSSREAPYRFPRPRQRRGRLPRRVCRSPSSRQRARSSSAVLPTRAAASIARSGSPSATAGRAASRRPSCDPFGSSTVGSCRTCRRGNAISACTTRITLSCAPTKRRW